MKQQIKSWSLIHSSLRPSPTEKHWLIYVNIHSFCSIPKHATMPQKFEKKPPKSGDILFLITWNYLDCTGSCWRPPLKPPHDHHHSEFLLFQTLSPMMPLHASLAQFWTHSRLLKDLKNLKLTLKPFNIHFPVTAHWDFTHFFSGGGIACNHLVQNSFPAALDLAERCLENCLCPKQSAGKETSA